MKSHELAKKLLSLPDRNIISSIDTSDDEKNAQNRCFSDSVFEVQDNGDSANTISICAEYGFVNF